MRLCTTLLIAALLMSASPVLAYRPLKGVPQNTANAPVVTRSVSTSLADKDGKLDSNWDTTIVLEQKDEREVAQVDVAFSLLGNQNRPIVVHRVVIQRDRPWKKGEQWEYRLQQSHLGWPGEATLVQVVSVAFSNGETWDSSEKPEQKLQDLPTPDGKNNAILPGNNPNSPYIPPIVLPSGGGVGSSSSSGTGYIPPVRPRVSPPSRPGFSRQVSPVPYTTSSPTPPPPSQAQPSPIPGSTTSPTQNNSVPSNPVPGAMPPSGGAIPSTGTAPVPVPTTPSSPTSPNSKATPTPEDLMR